ncbi:MAG: 3-oxoacyl-[acyl-carrier-protein] synthase, KASII [Ktedonobacterales bacterium]|jgi:3-oxoacyl-[acyl-carrier-protein] synthase II|nr:MAG: 3-oxoacyl-[acyl-carrier-protein] synthase, KASII [Ktedonobacterales bacterium]
MSKRVVVTGIGLISPVGNDTSASWKSFCEGRSGIGTITKFDASDQDVRIAGEIKGFDPLLYMDRKEVRRNDPFVHYALGATKQALADAELSITEENQDDVGVIIGSGIGGLTACHEQFKVLFDRGPDRVSPFFITQFITDIAAGYVSMQVGARGPNFATVSACATSANAIGEAAEMIRRGDAIAMIAGGAECGITPMGVASFAVMRALSRRNDDPEHASRPFDAERDGFVIAEGAGILILEEEEYARKRGARIYAELAGYASTADAYHVTEPAPEGAGLARAMKRAMTKAEVSPEQVEYINAHGTSTVFNDRNETAAIKNIFGDHAKHLAISSTKSMIGHTLGAAGGIEAGVTVLSLLHNVLTPTINYAHPDPECDLDYVPNEAREAKVNVALSNSMGFGGHNAVIVFKRYNG